MRNIRALILMVIMSLLFYGCPLPGVDDGSANGSGDYTVTYAPNGANSGTVPYDGGSYERYENAQVKDNTGMLRRDGYGFLGWNTSPTGDGTTYKYAENIFILSSNITLYALWGSLDPGIRCVSAGGFYSMFLKSDGSLYTAGQNGNGQLGTGTTRNETHPIKIMEGVKAISAGHHHTMILKDNGDLYATGGNSYGQLGTGDYSEVNLPVKVRSGVIAVDCGYYHTMVIDSDGKLYGTGNGSNYRLGNNSTDNTHTFTHIADGVAAVSAGSQETLFITNNGALYGFGENNNGNLGLGDTVERRIPTLITSGVRAVSAGLTHTMFITTNDELWAMGSSSLGELGNDTNAFSYRTLPEKALEDVKEVSSGMNYSMAIKNDNTLWCTGTNGTYGKLGIGLSQNSYIATWREVRGDVIKVDAGYQHTLIWIVGDSVYGAGKNGSGQLGNSESSGMNASFSNSRIFF